MSPILSYSGTRPLKRKKGGGRVIPPLPDQFLYSLNEVVDFDIDVPAKVRENIEADFKQLFKIRYNAYYNPKNQKITDELTGEDIYLGGTDPSEYEELPGVRGVPFDLGTLKDKGFQAALVETLESFKDSVLTLRDLRAGHEVVSIWDPLINPHINTDGTIESRMSLNAESVALELENSQRRNRGEALLTNPRPISELIKPERSFFRDKDGKRMDIISQAGDDSEMSLVFRDESGSTRNFISKIETGQNGKSKKNWYEIVNGQREKAIVNVTSIESVNRLGGSVRSFVVSGGSTIGRGINYPKLQQNMVDVLEVSLVRFPREAVGETPALQNSRNALIGRIDKVQKLNVNFNKLDEKRKKLAGDKGRGGKGVWKFVPNPILDEEIRKADKEYKSTLNKLWLDLAKNKDGIANTAATYADPRFVAWIEALNFRKNIFQWNEYLDNVAEGNIFKNFIWVNLKKSRFKYFAPDYWLTTAVNMLKERYANSSWVFRKLGRVNDWIQKATEKIVRSKVGGTILGLLGGQPIKIMVTKIVSKALMALGGTGVGTIPALLIATLTYALEKASSVLISFVKLDLDKALEQITKEATNLAKAVGAVALVLMIPGFIAYFLTISAAIAPLAGTDAGEGGQGGVYGNMQGGGPPGPPGVPPPGGGGVSCGNFGAGVDDQESFAKTGYKETITIPSGENHYITSCFAEDRGGYCHGGIDLNAGPSSDDGREVRSPFQGNAVVYYTGYQEDGFGYHVILKSSESEYYMYLAHMQQGSISVTVGQTVHKNDLIGLVGTTGNSSGPHMHFEIRSGSVSAGYAVNPCYIFNCPVWGGGLVCNTELYTGQP